MSNKLLQLELDLEQHRKLRQFDQMVATAKKISKTRGDSTGQLEALVAAEIAAEKLLADFAKERPTHFLLDSLGSVVERPKISASQAAELNPQITQAGKSQNANVLQGCLLCEAGEYPEAIALLKDLNEPTDPRFSSFYLRGLAARGKAYFLHGKTEEAASTFETLDAYVTKNEITVDEGSIRWIEDGLYLAPFLKFSKSSKENTLKAFRSYLMKGIYSDPIKRISILRNTIALLTQYFTNENYPKIEVPASAAYKNSPLTLNGELVLLVALLDYAITAANITIPTNELKTIYDEICAVLTPLGEYQMLLDILERSMKVYFGGDHFLMQYSLVLLSLERYEEAVVALNVCMKENEMAHYLASSTLINHLGNFMEGFKIAERALTFENGSLKSRLHQLVGLGYSRMAQKAWELMDKKDYQARAIDSLKKSLESDPQNPETLYLLALVYTEFLDIESAAKCARSSLLLSPDEADIWHLLALLKSCQYDFDNALKLCETGLQYDFADLGLWLTRTALIEKIQGPEAALISLCDTFAAIRQSFLENTSGVEAKDAGDRKTSSVFTPTTPASDVLRRRQTMQAAIQGGASLRRKTTMNKRPGLDIPQSQMSLDSSRSASPSPYISPSPSAEKLDSLTGVSFRMITSQDEAYVALWTTAANLYTKLNKLSESTECLKEACSFLPESAYLTKASTLVYYQYGLLKEAENDLQLALQKYEKVLTVDENHTPALIRMAAVQIKLEQYELAETNLRNALRLEPTSHEAWFHLGIVYEKTERLEKAADCLVTALELDNTIPIRPFSTLPRKLEFSQLTFIKDARAPVASA